MPMDEMQAAAANTALLQQELHADAYGDPAAGPQLAEQDYLVQQLLTWFKTKFFSWVSSTTGEHAVRTCRAQQVLLRLPAR